MLSVRLDKDTERKLEEYTSDREETKSAVGKKALHEFFENRNKLENPYLAGKELFGVASSGESDLSVSYKTKLKKKLNEKHTH